MQVYFKGQDVQGPPVRDGEFVSFNVITMSSGKCQANGIQRCANPALAVPEVAEMPESAIPEVGKLS
jgi:hypothetical protein